MSRFNIRVYGLWLRNHTEILVSEEMIRRSKVVKFPGGGLELGEGTLDGLKREWQEELGLPIDIKRHFYTTDFYQPSAWDDSQVISIYYIVCPLREMPFPYGNGAEQFYFLPVDKFLPEKITLPIDKVVAGKIIEKIDSCPSV